MTDVPTKAVARERKALINKLFLIAITKFLKQEILLFCLKIGNDYF